MYCIPDFVELSENETIERKKPSKFEGISHKMMEEIFDKVLNNTSDVYQSIFDLLIKKMVLQIGCSVGCICFNEASEHDVFRVVNKSFYTKSKSKRYKNTHFSKGMNRCINENLFMRGVCKKTCVISNDVQNDSRLKCDFPSAHIPVKTFLSIPILNTNNDSCIGQIIFVNKKKFSKKNIDNIFSLIQILLFVIYNFENKTIKTTNDLEYLKHNFLATMSHEIRTPLSGIVGMISLLPEAGTLNERQQDYLKRAINCCCQLMEIITDILDFSKMKSGTLALNDEVFDLKKCVEDAIGVVMPHSKHIELKYNIGNNVPNRIYGDSKRLRQILVNLLNNAAKFTSEGSVKLSVQLLNVDDGDDSTCKIKVSVSDTGIGIEKEQQSKIFDMFHRVEDSQITKSTNPKQGTGLGLAICKELLNLMGSDIFVKSDGLGHGTTFYFILDVQKEIQFQELKRKNSNNSIKNKKLNILAVDDVLNNRMFLSSYFNSWEMDATVCSSAMEALHYLRMKIVFDCIIIDICMPQMSGIEMAQKVRKEFPRIPLIALSSKEVDHQGRIWFDHFMIKPFNQVKLYKNILDAVSIPSTNKIKQIEKTKDNLRVCIVEDDDTNQYMLQEMLKIIGIQIKNIKIVGDGKQAVDEFKHNYYDICFMDLKMPVLDGFEASKQIKSLLNPPSIIVVSASILDSDKQKCSDIGIDGYLTKPIIKDDLENVIQRYI